MDEVDRGAEALLGRPVEHTGLADLGAGVAAALADDVVDVERLVTGGEVARVEVDSGTPSGEVRGKADGDRATAEGVLAHVDAGVVVGVDADALQVLLGVGRSDDLDDRDVRAGLGNHTQEGGRGRWLVARPGDGDDDGGRRALADHDAGVDDLALVGVDRDHDGLLAHGVRGNLHVAGVRRLRGDPCGDLLAHARLDLGEELRKREVDVALAGDLRNRERDVVDVQAVPGLCGRLVDPAQGDRVGHGRLDALGGH